MSDQASGQFIQTTQMWDVDELYSTDVNSREFKELLVRLHQNINSMAIAVNGKDTGVYDQNLFVTGQLFFPEDVDSDAQGEAEYQSVFRKVVNFGALPNTAAKTVAHGITCTIGTKLTRLYGAATNPTGGALSYLPLPYASPVLVNNIELSMDNTNVTITTGSNRTAYTSCYVIIEIINS